VDVRFVAPDLDVIDDLKSEALALTFFSDERPFQGTLGLLDWRMCGHVSQLRASGRITGERGETVLFPARPRLRMDKVFLFGLGSQASFDAAVSRDTVARLFDVLRDSRVRSAALVLPGRSTGYLSPVEAMERFVEAWARLDEQDEVVIIEPFEAQRAIQPVVDRERRRARAVL
jgi:hypothetical protein